MTVRKAQKDDFESIQELNYQIFEYEYDNCSKTMNKEYPYIETGIAYFKKIVNEEEGNSGFVYENKGVVVGYASLRIIKEQDLTHRTGIKQVQLQTLCVDKKHRGQGIGQALVAASKAWAKGQGANNLKVIAMAQNENARSFYKECGFGEYEIIHEVEL